MNGQVKRIADKILKLKKLDQNFAVFGAQRHRYLLNPPVSLDNIIKFESAHNLILPDGYVRFLTQIGNGGAGPFYGIEPLENTLFDDLDYKRPDGLLNPTEPFLYTEPWNMTFVPAVDEDVNEDQYDKELADFEKVYFDNAHMNGVLAICNFGCAVSLNLVVKGKEYGYIWTDDRASESGIHPSHELGNEQKIEFLDWYELWLDKSIYQVSEENKNRAATQNVNTNQSNGNRKWWQFWKNR